MTVCKNCTFETGRRPGCHDHCEKYLEEREKHYKAKALEKKDKDYDGYVSDSIFRNKNSKKTRGQR